MCGGFSVPIREGFADAIYIVTSGEFMPLYAANNIMKGIKRFSDRGGSLLGGLIHNSRGTGGDRHIVDEFARLTGTTVIQSIPRSEEILLAELEQKTVIERASEPEITEVFKTLAQNIIKDREYTHPNPLSDEEMDKLGEFISKNLSHQLHGR